MLVAGIVCNALGGRRILKHPGQLVGNFKIGVGIQMTIGSKVLWHTHPNGSIIPSETDYKAFEMVGKGNRPFLMSIIAHNNIGNWVLQ